LKRFPGVGKDLLEDAPVPPGYCHHPVAPRGGDTLVTVQRLSHGLLASSTPHRPVYSHPHPPLSSLSHGDFWDRENAFSYTIKKYIGFLFQLLTKLFKAFDNHSSINTTFNYVRKERLMTGQKP
jgi:hypothetical protein